MLKKIVSIKNVGRFKKHDAVGDVELKRYNLIFAENGRGKTTLCAILRSLQTGDAAHVLGRTTLGSNDAPEIRILSDAGMLNFTSGAWNQAMPELAIFDSTFVSENVFSGDYVDLDHKRSLYRVIIGKEGVELAKKIDDCDTASRDKASEISAKAASIQLEIPKGVTVETFLSLDNDADVDQKIIAKEKEFEAVKRADQIKTRTALSAISMPVIPAGFSQLLAKTIDDIDADIEERVADQIQAHAMHARGETWLLEGLGYVRDDKCPFCSQNLGPVAPLLAAYKTYFSQAYNDLRTAITDMRTAIDNALGDMQIATKIEKVIDQNAAAIEFWSRFCDFPAPAPPEGVGDTLRTLRQAALLLLDRKTAAPLDVVVPDATFSIAMAATDTQTQDIMGYNKDVTDANSIIATKKAATETSNVQLVESALAQLRLRKTRYRQEVVEACDAYRTAQQEKMRIEEEKAVVRKRLDDYTKEVIKKYEQTINALLADFNAGFSIAETKPAYFGGVASSTYRILINQTPVELGDEKTPLNKPSFRNTLSSGDKSTLALAFFLAQLLQDPNRSSRIVIFDDPFNSQDAFRKDHTVRKMRECGQDCAQVLVLSHDQQFLNRIWDCLREKAAERKTLELRRIGLQNTTILLWDIEAATQGAYKADRKVLTEFYHENRGDPRQVVQKIRPVLETYTKNLGAGALAEADTLGVIVGKIRTSGPTHQLYPVCDGLEELNIYTRRYMHGGENPNAATEPISDGELHGYVKRTLEITGGC